MTVADQILAHQSRCERSLLRLRELARAGPGPVMSRPAVAAEIRGATSMIIVEAEDAGWWALAATSGGRRRPHAEMFLWVRLSRLMTAADEAVRAALDGDAGQLTRDLRRFEDLARAIWAVQHAVYDQAPAVGPDGRAGDVRESGIR